MDRDILLRALKIGGAVVLFFGSAFWLSMYVGSSLDATHLTTSQKNAALYAFSTIFSGAAAALLREVLSHIRKSAAQQGAPADRPRASRSAGG